MTHWLISYHYWLLCISGVVKASGGGGGSGAVTLNTFSPYAADEEASVTLVGGQDLVFSLVFSWFYSKMVVDNLYSINFHIIPILATLL